MNNSDLDALYGAYAGYDQIQQPPSYEQPHEVSAIAVRAVIAGVTYLVKSISVELNAHGAADSADITLSLKSAPDLTVAFNSSSTQASVIPVSLYLGMFQTQQQVPQGLSTAGLTQIFSGQVDMYTLDFSDPYLVTMHCRSLAAQLIDNRITAIPRNMTTTQFVQAIAKQYSLTPVIKLAANTGAAAAFTSSSSITVAQVYERTIAVGIQNDRIWDALLKMAQIDDTDVWVVGSTLYYCAPQAIQRNVVDVKYGRDILKSGFQIVKSINASNKIRVEVRTYEPSTKTSSIQRVETGDNGGVKVTNVTKVVTSNFIPGTANSQSVSISSTGAQTVTNKVVSGGVHQSTASTGTVAENGPLIYRIYKPGLSQEAANRLAQATWRRISAMLYTTTLPVSLKRSNYKQLLDITATIRLHGLPMLGLNDTYWPRSIKLSVDVESGASCEIHAQNVTLPDGLI